jgi:hypothetical protein
MMAPAHDEHGAAGDQRDPQKYDVGVVQRQAGDDLVTVLVGVGHDAVAAETAPEVDVRRLVVGGETLQRGGFAVRQGLRALRVGGRLFQHAALDRTRCRVDLDDQGAGLDAAGDALAVARVVRCAAGVPLEIEVRLVLGVPQLIVELRVERLTQEDLGGRADREAEHGQQDHDDRDQACTQRPARRIEAAGSSDGRHSSSRLA